MEEEKKVYTKIHSIKNENITKINLRCYTNFKEPIFQDQDNKLHIFDSKNDIVRKFDTKKERLRNIIPNFSSQNFNNYSFFYQYDEAIYGYDSKKGRSRIILVEEDLRYSKLMICDDRLFLFSKKIMNSSRIKVFDLRVKKVLVELWIEFPNKKLQIGYEIYSYIQMGFKSKREISCFSLLKFIPNIMELKGSNIIQMVSVSLIGRKTIPKEVRFSIFFLFLSFI